jgi:hypothetical protein
MAFAGRDPAMTDPSTKSASSRSIRVRGFAMSARFAHRIFAFNNIRQGENEKAGKKSRPWSQSVLANAI